jgi:hypothetical protein
MPDPNFATIQRAAVHKLFRYGHAKPCCRHHSVSNQIIHDAYWQTALICELIGSRMTRNKTSWFSAPQSGRRVTPVLFRVIMIPQLLYLAGCGGQDLHPVHGKVTFPDQTPLPGGWVEMKAADETGGTPRGPIQSDGTFEIGTKTAGDGARAGKYRVMVSPPVGLNPDVPKSEQPPEVRIDRRFTSFATSGIEFEVDPNISDNRLEIVVERAK